MYSALWSLVKPSLFALFLSSFYPPLLSISLSSSFLPFVILLLLCMWKHPPKSNFQLALSSPLSPLQSTDKSRPLYLSHTLVSSKTEAHKDGWPVSQPSEHLWCFLPTQSLTLSPFLSFTLFSLHPHFIIYWILTRCEFWGHLTHNLYISWCVWEEYF